MANKKGKGLKGLALTRRQLMAGAGGLAATSIVSWSASAQQAKEAPEFVQLVADKKLPPLAERLPKIPLVVTPVERVGRYGGQIRRGLRGSADHNGILRMVGNQGLTRGTWNSPTCCRVSPTSGT